MADALQDLGETTSLIVAGGRQVPFCGDPNDLSVFAVIRAQHGEWEPHVRHCLERLVKPEFVCLDIGANLGAHSLSLAALANNGRVVCFEASPRNYRHLRRNVDQLGADAARVDTMNVALWDSTGTLKIAAVDELAGCSFISPDRDESESEATIRRVVDSAAIRDTTLHVHHDSVPAIRLDDWVAAAKPRRINLIKMDVEGAESRVLAGGRRMLQRFRPILITEYNPSCAVQYFDQPERAYFDTLRAIFADIRIIEPDGLLSESLVDWPALQRRLKSGRGWEDLLCAPPAKPRGWLSGLLQRMRGERD